MRLLPVRAPALADPSRPNDGTNLYEIPGWATASVRGRIGFLRELADEHGKDPMLMQFVIHRILKPAAIAPREFRRQAAALLRWVQTNIYYINEPDERIATPWRTLEWRAGDCDDEALLLAAFAQSIGLASRFVLTGPGKAGRLVRWIEGQGSPASDVEWSHIYVQIGWPALQPRFWTSAEATMPDAPLGYDVAVDGVVADREGRIRVPRPGDAAYMGRDTDVVFSGPPREALRPYGAARQPNLQTQLDPTSPKPSVFDAGFWHDAMLAAVQGLPAAVVSGVVLWYISQRLDQWAKQR